MALTAREKADNQKARDEARKVEKARFDALTKDEQKAEKKAKAAARSPIAIKISLEGVIIIELVTKERNQARGIVLTAMDNGFTATAITTTIKTREVSFK